MSENSNTWFNFRVNVNGIGTCLLSLDLPKLGPYDDPEFDLFVKILQCRLRTSKLYIITYKTKIINLNKLVI